MEGAASHEGLGATSTISIPYTENAPRDEGSVLSKYVSVSVRTAAYRGTSAFSSEETQVVAFSGGQRGWQVNPGADTDASAFQGLQVRLKLDSGVLRRRFAVKASSGESVESARPANRAPDGVARESQGRSGPG